jgi:hypothetical protein
MGRGGCLSGEGGEEREKNSHGKGDLRSCALGLGWTFGFLCHGARTDSGGQV